MAGSTSFITETDLGVRRVYLSRVTIRFNEFRCCCLIHREREGGGDVNRGVICKGGDSSFDTSCV